MLWGPDVKLVGDLRIVVLCALVWALLAAACLAMTVGLGAELPIWLPAGLSVAQFGLLPKQRWPLACAALGTASLAVTLAAGASLTDATIFALATLAEGTICATLGLWALQGNVQVPEGPRQVVGLFGAAFAGSIGFTVVMIGASGPGGQAVASELFAHLLGMLTMTSLVLHLRRRLVERDPAAGPMFTAELAWTMAFVAALSIVLLQAENYLLVPVLLTGLVLATIRLAAPAPAINVLLVAAIATLFSTGGRSPLPNLDSDPAEAMLLIQTWLALALATAVPIASVLARRDNLAGKLAQQNARLEENVTIFGLAEELAGIGRWQLDLASGAQVLSPVMVDLLGTDSQLAEAEGNDIRDLLQSGGDTVFDELDRNCRESAPFSFDCRIKPTTGPERILRFSAQNDFNAAGVRKAVFAVAMDVTGQVRREEALDLARGRAVRLAAEAQKLANTDVLTELPNRRCSLGLLERLVEQAQRDGTNLSVLLFDIDHFKKVNDTYGHKAGDDVLLRVASLARREMRGSDLVGRIGGEEFVCLMPGLGPNDARALAERLRGAIAADSAVEDLPPVTVSVGIACMEPQDDAGSLLARADEALYGAKEGGRNQVRRAA